jgi:hypothetical protein
MKDEWDFDDDEDEEDLDAPLSPSLPNIMAEKPPTPSSALSKASSKGSNASKSAGSAVSSPTVLSQASTLSSSQHSTSIATNNSITSPLLRTRTARLKAKVQKVSASPHRRVRFELTSSDASSAATASTQGYRSFAESPLQKRKQRQRKRQWNLKEDGDDFLEGSSPSDLRTTGGDAKPFANPRQPPVLKTSSVDMYAMQDTVKAQRLADELGYCCDTLRNSRNASRQLEAVADLSLLLSNRMNRQSLFSNHHDREEASPLTILLHLMEWFHERTADALLVGSPIQSPVSSDPTCHARVKRQSLAETNINESPPRPSTLEAGVHSKVLNAIGIVWHFLSIDCTMSKEASVRTSGAARKLRESFLENHFAVQTLLEMVVEDSYMDSLLGISSKWEATDISVESTGGGTLSQESTSRTCSIPDSPQSLDSTGSIDPTLAGRRRKRMRKQENIDRGLDSIPENVIHEGKKAETQDDYLSYTSESTGLKSRDDNSLASASSQASAQAQLDKILSKVTATAEDCLEETHTCGIDKNLLLAKFPLLSFCRIVSGKYEGDEISCIDDEAVGNPVEDEQDDLSRNPLHRTNVMLSKSGAISFIASATSRAALAIVRQVTRCPDCTGCDTYLRWKFCTLTSLVDDTCLFMDANRAAFLTEGFAPETGGYLLTNLACILLALLQKSKVSGDSSWNEVTIAALRTLTSLTHENEMAALELQTSSIKIKGIPMTKSLDVVVRVLYASSSLDGDTTIFCLNTLANILESGGSWEPFSKIKVGDDNEPFLKWVTKFVVRETKSFQNAVVESSFSSSDNRHAERQLDRHENEALMMAGNAFIFLTCILVQVSAKTSDQIQLDIFAELPGETEAAKLLFIKNTLKAFCNLYHFSVGALSVAIVAPVKKLLVDLEKAYGLANATLGTE